MISKKTVVAAAAAALAVAVAVPFKAFSQLNVSVNLGDHHHHDHDHHGFAHPEIDAAMAHLSEARNNLQNAAHDFGGHRVAALNAVNEALRRCNKAIEYANSHDR